MATFSATLVSQSGTNLTFRSAKGVVLACTLNSGPWPQEGERGTMTYNHGANHAKFDGRQGTTFLWYSGRAYSDWEL